MVCGDGADLSRRAAMLPRHALRSSPHVPIRAPTPTSAVTTRNDTVVFPTYMPAMPDRNPMFLEKRVYQGSSGRVYPLPFTDRVNTEPADRQWRAVWLENEYRRVLVLPEIGGRAFNAAGRSRTGSFGG